VKFLHCNMSSSHSIQKHQGSFIFGQDCFNVLLRLDGIYNTKTEGADGGDKAGVISGIEAL